MSLAESLIRQLKPPIDMLEIAIETTPVDVWSNVDGDWPIWQHILHAIYFYDKWMRLPSEPFVPPAFVDVDAAALDKPGVDLGRDFVRLYLVDVHDRVVQMLSGMSDAELRADIDVNGESKPMLDIAIGQIRHLMYHAGCISAILRRATGEPLPWVGYHKPANP